MNTKWMLPVTALLFLVASESVAQQLPAPTTWYIVRHAERDGSDDALTPVGFSRSDTLASLMEVLRVTHIYSTDTQRTRDTAAPTAAKLSLPVTLYGNHSKQWFEKMKAAHPGDVVLIVGHSNTVDKLVEGFGGQGDFKVSDDEYDNLFVVSTGGGKTRAMRIRFGQKSK
ncbi:MAG: histidine phosphatase family protein [Mariniblastus sp.]|nr:histidine phosphatase family protein [Mariniblastus sp.]